MSGPADASVLDRETGALRFGDVVDIGPTATKSKFLASNAGAIARPLVTNGRYCSFRLPEMPGSERFVVVDEHLNQIHLCDGRPEFGTSWDDYTEELELRRKKAHDQWLTAILGSDRVFSWDKVESVFDPKGGSASIVVTYF